MMTTMTQQNKLSDESMRLYMALKQKGLTQQEVADKFNRSRQYIHEILKDPAQLSVDEMKQFGEILGMDYHTFFSVIFKK